MHVNGAPGSYNVEGLEEGNVYRIRVFEVFYAFGGSLPSNIIIAKTQEKSKSHTQPILPDNYIHTATGFVKHLNLITID